MKEHNLDISKLDKNEKTRLIYIFASVALLEYIEEYPFQTEFFSSNETDFRQITKGGIKKIFKSVYFTCEKFSIDRQSIREIFRDLQHVISVLSEHGYENDDQASKIREIFYWVKIGSK